MSCSLSVSYFMASNKWLGAILEMFGEGTEDTGKCEGEWARSCQDSPGCCRGWEHLKFSFVACSVSRASVCPRMLIWRKCLLQKGRKAQRLSVVTGAASWAMFVPGQTKQALCAVQAGSSAPRCFPCIITPLAKFISCARAEGGVKYQEGTVCVNTEHLPLLIFLRFHLSFAGSAQELILCLFIYCRMGTGL